MKKASQKINHEWSVLSSSSIVDQDSNNLSLINTIEQIAFDAQLGSGETFNKEGEVIPFNMVITTRLRKLIPANLSVKGSLKIDFVDPKHSQMGTFSQDFEMGADIKNIRIRSGIAGLKVTESGLYHFEIYLKEEDMDYEKIYSLPLEMILNIS